MSTLEIKERKRTLSSGVRCLEVLRLLSHTTDDLPLQQIAVQMGLHASTTHRILATLVAQGFVVQAPGRRYRLGLEAFMVGAGFLRRSILRRASVPTLMRLAEQTRASVNLALWRGGKVVMLDCLPMPGMYHFYNEPGAVLPPHATALGKCFLAFGGEDFLNQISPLNPFTQNTICTLTGLKKELDRIRKCGYAVDNEEYLAGARCLAAPILKTARDPVAAISISAPPTMLPLEKVPELAALVREACLHVSLQVGYKPTAQPVSPRTVGVAPASASGALEASD